MKDKHQVHYSSAKEDWGTPPDLFAKLHKLYGFTHDVACSSSNRLCEQGFEWPTQDGLAETWEEARVFCNPPYGREISKWVQKANQEAHRAILIVMLVPSRTDTIWWHEAIKQARPVFLKGRLKFKGASSSAPFPSALLIWNM